VAILTEAMAGRNQESFIMPVVGSHVLKMNMYSSSVWDIDTFNGTMFFSFNELVSSCRFLTNLPITNGAWIQQETREMFSCMLLTAMFGKLQFVEGSHVFNFQSQQKGSFLIPSPTSAGI
jgi:hypothetical protein